MCRLSSTERQARTSSAGWERLRTGRIAYRDPRWTPASGSGIPRDPADLTPGQPDLGTVLAAVHHTIDALARIAAEDCEAVRAAAADHRLYLPTRRIPAGHTSMSRRYRPAPRPRVDALLDRYQSVIAADNQAVAALDHLTGSLAAPSQALAVLRSGRPLSSPPLPAIRGNPHPAAGASAAAKDHPHGAVPRGWHMHEQAGQSQRQAPSDNNRTSAAGLAPKPRAR